MRNSESQTRLESPEKAYGTPGPTAPAAVYQLARRPNRQCARLRVSTGGSYVRRLPRIKNGRHLDTNVSRETIGRGLDRLWKEQGPCALRICRVRLKQSPMVR
jgi:hypothetical protein